MYTSNVRKPVSQQKKKTLQEDTGMLSDRIGGIQTNDEGDERSTRADAIQRRLADNQTKGLSAEKAEKKKKKREKDNLVGRITAVYRNMGQDPPFGLAAASIPGLKRHLERVQQQSRKQAKTNAKLNAIGGR